MGANGTTSHHDSNDAGGWGEITSRLTRLGVDESLALALIEGELGEGESQRVRAMLMQDDRLATLLGRMAQDRVALVSLGPEVRIGRDMRPVIEARIERESLLGMESAASGDLARSRIAVRRRSRIVRLMDNVSPQAVMAASIALVAGLGLLGFGLLVHEVWQRRDPIVKSTTPDTVAQDPSGAGRPTIPNRQGAPSDALADGQRPTNGPDITPREPAQPTMIAHREAVEDIDVATAVELLREGRLAIRLRSSDPLRSMASVESTLADVRFERIQGGTASQLATEMHASLRRGAERVINNPNAPDASDPERREAARVLRELGDVVAVYAVEVAADQGSLERLAAALTTGPDQVAEFVRLDQPVRPTMRIDPESVIWWGYGSSRWAVRAPAPILVERRPAPTESPIPRPL